MQKLIFLLLTVVNSLPRNLRTIVWKDNRVNIERNTIVHLQCQNKPQKSQNITRISARKNVNIKVVKTPISNIKYEFQRYLLQSDSSSIINLLILGFDINSIDLNAMTPLHNAINLNNKNMASLLIDYGADINCSYINYLTPLHHVISNKNIGTLYYLTKSIANVAVKNNH